MANVRSISVKLLAEVGNYVQGFQRAKSATGDLMTELSKSEQARANFQRLGTMMVVAGAGIAAGIGLATRAAINWESSWAGVIKTVDGSSQQLATLEDDLRSMARELPASHSEIAAVAEAAGQLGIKVDDVADFTRTMIDMGEATNLSAEEAAFSIAQMVNVMGTSVDDVDRLASAVVDLGNNSATTEADIVAMAQRIAGAGSTIGLTETEVLGFAAALSSVGIRAEAGGSAISRAMINIEQAVRAGGEELETLAQVAGMSASEFRQAYEQDAATAIATFVAGLGRMQASGEDVFATLDKLGFTEIRLRDALLRLASSGDLLTESLRTSEAAWDENIALQEEAERRYGTTAAQMAIARNQINDFAISMGETFLPVVGEVAGRVGALAEVFADLPGPAQTAVGVVAALASGLLLLGGGLLLLVPRIAATKSALDQLAASGGRAAAAAGALRTATSFLLGPWGFAIAAAVGIATAAFASWSNQQAEARQGAQEMADTLDELTGEFTKATRALVAHKLEESGALEAARELGVGLTDLTDAAMGNAEAHDRVFEAVQRSKEGIEAGSKADIERWKTLGKMLEGLEGVQAELDDGVAAWERTNEATQGALSTITEIDPAARDLADAFGVSATAANDVTDAVDQLDEELQQLFDRVFGLQNAQDDLADAFDNLTEQIQQQRDAGVEGAGSLKGMSEAARENRDAAQALLETYGEVILETIRTSGSQKEAKQAVKSFEDALDELEEQTGVNIREMDGYNDIVDEIDRLIEVTFRTPGVQNSIQAAKNLQQQLDAVDRFIEVVFKYKTEGALPSPGGAPVPQRWGGVTMHAQTGLLRSARIFPPVAPARFAFAEPMTGGEAFVPRRGDRERSLAIADVAAQWHGGRVVAGDGESVGGPFQWRGQRVVAAGDGATAGNTTTTTYNVYPQRADFSISDLDALQRRQDALARVGRPH